MRKHILLLLIAASTLTACASGARPTATPPPKLTVPASLTADCADLPQPTSGKTQDLLDNHVQVARIFHLCREQLRSLAQWLETTGD